MIDLRCHVLDGTACGPASFEESVEMCRKAFADGVRMIVATPRWKEREDNPPLSFDEAERKLERLRAATDERLSFRLGFVMPLGQRLPQLVKRYGEAIALGKGRYILVQLPAFDIPAETENILAEIEELGFHPLLARPECSPCMRQHEERWARWLDNGAMAQVDARSVQGAHGRTVQTAALRYLESHWKNLIIASNARRADSVAWPLGAAREQTEKSAGARHANIIFRENPARILKDETQKTGKQPSGAFSELFRLLGSAKNALEES